MNWKGIFKFSIYLSIVLTLASAISTVLVGAEDIDDLTSYGYFAYFELPNLIIYYFILDHFAKHQKNKLFFHLVLSVASCFILTNSIVILMTDDLSFLSIWYLDIIAPLTIIILITLNKGEAKSS